MNERLKSKLIKTIGFRDGISRCLLLCVLLVVVLVVSVCLVLVLAKKPRIYPQQEITVKYCTFQLVDELKKGFSLASDWPDKDKSIDELKTRREPFEHLEYGLGPIEIRENETFDEATRVVVPMISFKYKRRSTGEITIMTDPNGQKVVGTILEKQDTAEGSHWLVIDGPKKFEIHSSDWYDLPRKKVPRSPTIILKKAVLIQVVYDGKVVSERTVPWDQWSIQEGRDEKEN